jgi:hypothetical protein
MKGYLAVCVPRAELGDRAAARNKEVERARKLGADALLMVDTDEIMPIETLREIEKELENSDIVIVDAPCKIGAINSNVTYGENFVMMFSGLGCFAAKMSVFDKVGRFTSKYAWIVEDHKIKNRVKKGFDDGIGEDVDFIIRANKKGLIIKIAEGRKCKHGFTK